MPDPSLTTQIAVVGGGPAGTRAAELLSAHGAEVLLLDAKAPWEKPCGGGLTESAFQDFPELRELEPVMQPIRSMRIETDAQHGFTVPLATPMWIVSRRTLGRWQLTRALEAGAVHLSERVRSIERAGGGWRLETDRRVVWSERLVGADGAASLVRRIAAPDLRVELAATRVAFVPRAGPTPSAVLVRLFPQRAGYVWDFPRPDHRSVGIGLQSGAWARPRMDEEVDAFRRSSEDCRRGDQDLKRAGAVIGTAQLGHGDFSSIGGPDFALLGDAAGLADPASGEGIRNALRSSQLLGSAWLRDGTFGSYPFLARRAFDREFRVSRMLRRVMLESRSGAWIVSAAQRHAGPYAVIATLADAINENDGSVPSLLRRWWAARGAARRDPSVTASGPRLPVPCGCGCASSPHAVHAGNGHREEPGVADAAPAF